MSDQMAPVVENAAPAATPQIEPVSAPTSPAPAAASAEPPEAGYSGSKELNPLGRPLSMDVSGWEQGAVDEFIRERGEDAFAEAPKAEEAPEAAKDAPEAEKSVEAPAEAKGDEAMIAELTQGLGISPEDLAALPEKVQERLIDSYLDAPASAVTEVQQRYESLSRDVEALRADAVIAARLAELNSGTRVVATPDQILNEDVMGQVDALLESGNQAEAVNVLRQAVSKAVLAERSVIERQQNLVKTQEDLNAFFADFVKLDPRLDTVKERDLRKMNEAHPEYAKFGEGLGKVIKYAESKGWKADTLKTLGADGLYRLYSAHMGWDKERDKKIAQESRAGILKTLGQIKKAAATPDHGRRSIDAMPGSSSGAYDREALIDEMVKSQGRSDTYNRLLAANESNPSVMQELFAIHDEAVRRSKAR